MDLSSIFCIVFLVIIIGVTVASIVIVKKHTMGTLKLDNSGDTLRCLLEFEDLNVLDNQTFVIVKVKNAYLGLPGEMPQS